MRVYATARHDEDAIDIQRVEQAALFALEYIDAPASSEASITFVDDEEIAALNEQYRQKPGPTDVLSFECDGVDDDFPDAPFQVCDAEAGEGASAGADAGAPASAATNSAEAAPYELGDVVIAPDVARRQADEYGNAFADEIDMLVVHGILHLNGYDHIEDADAEVMEPLQRDILAAFAKSRGQ